MLHSVMMNSVIVLLFSIELLKENVFGERMESTKTETRVEIEVAYFSRQYIDKSSLISQTKPVHKTVQFTYNIPNLPKTVSSEFRGVNRQPNSNNNNNNNNNNNLRHGFRFSTIEKGAGAFTMSTYENEGSESGVRVRNNIALSGKLIHVVSVSPAQQFENNGASGANYSTLSWSHNACHETVNSVEGHWVALVQSGACPAEQKLRQIMKLANQPVSVLIYGSSQVLIKQDSFLSLTQDDSPMVIFLPWSNIQGVVQQCFNSSGQIILHSELLSKLNRSSLKWPYSDQNQCNVTIKVYTTSDDNFLNKTSVLFVSISFILLMVISLAWLMFYYVQRFRYIHTKEQFSRRLAHMAKKAVAKIPVKTLKQGDKETDAEVENCAICIECYKPSDTVRILPCKHYFHKSCIDPWLLEQRSCPMCKLNILHAYGFLPNERGSIISEDRLSELDSSLEQQFLPSSIISTYTAPSTRIQAHCLARELSDLPATSDPITGTSSSSVAIIALPSPTFPGPITQCRTRWTSLRLKPPFHGSQHIDRSLSLRHLSSSIDERTTFLPHNRPLSDSVTNNVLQRGLSLHTQWPDPATSSCSAAATLVDNTADCYSEIDSQ